MFEQSKLIFGLVKLTPYYEVHIYTQVKIFVEDDISAYEYSKIRVRKCSALSQRVADYFIYCTVPKYGEETRQTCSTGLFIDLAARVGKDKRLSAIATGT